MRQYPICLYKTKEDTIRVNSEPEEIAAALEGYETHWNSEVNEMRKGTDKEVLRGDKKVVESKLSPQQRAAITRKRNKEAKEALNGSDSK